MVLVFTKKHDIFTRPRGVDQHGNVQTISFLSVVRPKRAESIRLQRSPVIERRVLCVRFGRQRFLGTELFHGLQERRERSRLAADQLHVLHQRGHVFENHRVPAKGGRRLGPVRLHAPRLPDEWPVPGIRRDHARTPRHGDKTDQLLSELHVRRALSVVRRSVGVQCVDHVGRPGPPQSERVQLDVPGAGARFQPVFSRVLHDGVGDGSVSYIQRYIDRHLHRVDMRHRDLPVRGTGHGVREYRTSRRRVYGPPRRRR